MVAGSVLGAAAVGGLRATKNLIGAANVLLLGLGSVAPVRAAQCFHDGGRDALLSYLRRLTLLGGAACCLIVGVVAVAPAFWLDLLYGAAFVKHSDLVLWWAVAFILGFFTLPPVFGLRALEQTKFLFWSQFYAAVFSVACSYPLIYYFGLSGAMFGILAIPLIRMGILTVAFKRQVSLLA